MYTGFPKAVIRDPEVLVFGTDRSLQQAARTIVVGQDPIAAHVREPKRFREPAHRTI